MAAADSWYHETETAWLYAAVAAAEPDPRRRELFLKLAAAAEEQAACWRRRDPGIPDHYAPALRARIVARLLRHIQPRHLRRVLAAMKLRGLSVYACRHAPVTHAMPTSASEVGGRHTALGGNNLRALSLFTGHGAVRGGLRQVLVGGGAGLAAWSIGKLLGASVG